MFDDSVLTVNQDCSGLQTVAHEHTHIHTHTHTYTHTHTHNKYTKYSGFITVPNKCGTENICIFKELNTCCKMTMATNACGFSTN